MGEKGARWIFESSVSLAFMGQLGEEEGFILPTSNALNKKHGETTVRGMLTRGSFALLVTPNHLSGGLAPSFCDSNE